MNKIDVEGLILSNEPLSNFQLIDAAKKLRIKNFRGVYVRDQLITHIYPSEILKDLIKLNAELLIQVIQTQMDFTGYAGIRMDKRKFALIHMLCLH